MAGDVIQLPLDESAVARIQFAAHDARIDVLMRRLWPEHYKDDPDASTSNG
jgi:hypothetical protein